MQSITDRDTYLLPRTDDIVDSYGGASTLPTSNANSKCWEIRITKEESDTKVFTWLLKIYGFSRTLFKLMNAPTTFQSMLDILRSSPNWKTCLLYHDEVIIFCKSFYEHMRNADNVPRFFQRAETSLKLKRCDFFPETGKYAGHIVKPGKLAIGEACIKSLKKIGYPRTINELPTFLALCNFYRRLIPRYFNIAVLCKKLLCRETPRILKRFGDKGDQAFRQTINFIISTPVLALFRTSFLFCRQYGCKRLSSRERAVPNLSRRGTQTRWIFVKIAEGTRNDVFRALKKFYAGVAVFQTLRPYLQDVHFTIHTHYASLPWLIEIKKPSERL